MNTVTFGDCWLTIKSDEITNRSLMLLRRDLMPEQTKDSKPVHTMILTAKLFSEVSPANERKKGQY